MSDAPPPPHPPARLRPDQLERYSRHLLLPGFGAAQQRALAAARVLVVGAGGLGSASIPYLIAAGVGHLTVVDGDVVELSNLQRQILHRTRDVGRPKVVSAARWAMELNPDVALDARHERLDADGVRAAVRAADVVLDGTDNFATRYLVNDACVLRGLPNVYGSIFRFDGQASVFAAPHGPCYRCLYREPPPEGLVPSCAEGGVLGVLPGLVGTIQATEAIKLLTGAGTTLIGRLLLVDALHWRQRTVRVAPDPRCPACGTREIRDLADSVAACATGPAIDAVLAPLPEIEPATLHARRAAGHDILLLDVREPHEWAIARIEGARLIPLASLDSRLGELSRDREIVVHCKGGGRSAQAVRRLRAAGFRKVANLAGGIQRWSRDVDPSVPCY